MIRVVVIIIIICILIAVIKAILEKIGPYLLLSLVVIIPTMIIHHIYPEIKLYQIVIGVIVIEIIATLLITGSYKLYVILKRKRERRIELKKVNEWLNVKPPLVTEDKVVSVIYEFAKEMYHQSGGFFDEIYMLADAKSIPIGRSRAFLYNFIDNIAEETPLAMFIKKSKDYTDIKEYGCLLTDMGLYILEEPSESQKILFGGLYKVVKLSDYRLGFEYIECEEKRIRWNVVDFSGTGINVSVVLELCKFIMKVDLNHSIVKYGVISNRQYNDLIENVTKDKFMLLEIESKYKITGLIEEMWALHNSVTFNKEELKGYMNGRQGHGYAAEYANNTIDKLMGKNVVNAAQQLDESGRQVKDGADRIVNSVEYQTKYYKTAGDAVNSIIQNGEIRYKTSSGTAMTIEVPKGQKAEVEYLLRKRYESGEISELPSVVEGHITYRESQMIKQALTIQGLEIDIFEGFVQAFDYTPSMLLINFAVAIWNGQERKEAVKYSLAHTMKNMAYGVAVNTLITQLNRKEIANIFKPTENGFEKLADNYIAELAEDIAYDIRGSEIANSKLGKALGLDKTTSLQIIGTTVSLVIAYGPDFWKRITGKISKDQHHKNNVINTVTLLGGALGGATLGVVGAVLGAGIAGAVAKDYMDERIEDDAVKMYVILKEEFIDVTMQANLTEEEFQRVINNTLASEELKDILQEMFCAESSREYANEYITQAVIDVMTERKQITWGMYLSGVFSAIMPYVEKLCKEKNIPSEVIDMAYMAEKIAKVL